MSGGWEDGELARVSQSNEWASGGSVCGWSSGMGSSSSGSGMRSVRGLDGLAVVGLWGSAGLFWGGWLGDTLGGEVYLGRPRSEEGPGQPGRRWRVVVGVRGLADLEVYVVSKFKSVVMPVVHCVGVRCVVVVVGGIVLTFVAAGVGPTIGVPVTRSVCVSAFRSQSRQVVWGGGVETCDT